jgi:hypothetical protein
MKEVPQQSVDQPGPFAVPQFLARQDISPPPELFSEYIKAEDDEINYRNPPLASQGNAQEKSAGMPGDAARGPTIEGKNEGASNNGMDASHLAVGRRRI